MYVHIYVGRKKKEEPRRKTVCFPFSTFSFSFLKKFRQAYAIWVAGKRITPSVLWGEIKKICPLSHFPYIRTDTLEDARTRRHTSACVFSFFYITKWLLFSVCVCRTIQKRPPTAHHNPEQYAIIFFLNLEMRENVEADRHNFLKKLLL